MLLRPQSLLPSAVHSPLALCSCTAPACMHSHRTVLRCWSVGRLAFEAVLVAWAVTFSSSLQDPIGATCPLSPATVEGLSQAGYRRAGAHGQHLLQASGSAVCQTCCEGAHPAEENVWPRAGGDLWGAIAIISLVGVYFVLYLALVCLSWSNAQGCPRAESIAARLQPARWLGPAGHARVTAATVIRPSCT